MFEIHNTVLGTYKERQVSQKYKYQENTNIVKIKA